MRILRRNNKTWTNVHQSFKKKIKSYFDVANSNGISMSLLDSYNESTIGFMEMIKEHLSLKQSLRVIGGGWSWSEVAFTDDVLINSKPLNLSFPVEPEMVSDMYTKQVQDLYFVQCGVSIKEINDRLKSINRSLFTSGASNGQTIAGAISTGTHGSAIDFGSTSEFVVGIHIIVDKDRHFYLERNSYPVVSDLFSNSIDTTIIRDDDIFNSALVSFGSFGIIHGVMIETTPLFLYESHRDVITLDDKYKDLLESLDFNDTELNMGDEKPYHFQVIINPHKNKSNLFVTRMYKRDFDALKENIPNPEYSMSLGEDGIGFLGSILQISSTLTKISITEILKKRYEPHSFLYGTHGDIFGNTSTVGKVNSLAIAVPLKHVLQVLDIIHDLIKNHRKFLAISALRYVAKSKAMLGFTKYDPSCVIEIDGVSSARLNKFYNLFSDVLLTQNIDHTFHWGKTNKWTKSGIIKTFGEEKVNIWLRSREKLIQKEDLMELFTNQWMRGLGLDRKLSISGDLNKAV